jgi:site-specific DNA-cytosine methylase
MKLLDLFSGTQSISSVFRANGWETYTIDKSDSFKDITDWQTDILQVTAQDILDRFGRPSVIWASPDCTSYSIAAIKHHRTRESDGHLAAKSEYAKFCDEVNQHVLKLIEELNPEYYFIENPRGGMRKQRWMQHLPIYTVWYCTYGDKRAKPTDIWTNHPDPQFKPVCRNGNPDCHHERAKRGAKTGTQGLKGSIERSRIPKELCEHIFKIASENL